MPTPTSMRCEFGHRIWSFPEIYGLLCPICDTDEIRKRVAEKIAEGVKTPATPKEPS